MNNDLIQVKESTTYPGLFVHKYKRKVFFNNLWNRDKALVESRGHVYDKNGKRVINAPTKVFNHKENGTDIDPNEECVVIRKVNGFMACATWVPQVNDVVVSTTGSLDSDYAKMAKEMMPQVIAFLRNSKDTQTYFFEICHPNDPHIVNENCGVYLLGSREVSSDSSYFTSSYKEYELDDGAFLMNVMRPQWLITKFKDVLEQIKNCKHEGYMVYGQESGTVLKLKSPYYLASKAIARKKDIMTLDKKRVDEEFYDLLDTIKEMGEDFNALNEQERLNFIRNYFKD